MIMGIRRCPDCGGTYSGDRHTCKQFPRANPNPFLQPQPQWDRLSVIERKVKDLEQQIAALEARATKEQT